MVNQEELNRQLFAAVIKEDVSSVLSLLVQGADIDAKDYDGDTVLIIASQRKLTGIAQILLAHGADTEAKNNKGNTALLVASWRGHAEIVQLLLAHGTAIEVKDNHGFTAFMYAFWNGNLEMALVLLDAGADLNATNNNGKTALIIAQERRETETVAFLNSAIEQRQLLGNIEPGASAPKTPEFNF